MTFGSFVRPDQWTCTSWRRLLHCIVVRDGQSHCKRERRIENFVRFEHVVFEICERTETHRDKHFRHADCTTSRGGINATNVEFLRRSLLWRAPVSQPHLLLMHSLPAPCPGLRSASEMTYTVSSGPLNSTQTKSRAPEPVADVRRPLTVCRKRLWHEIILFIVFLSAVFRAKFVNDKAPGLQPSCSGHGALWMSKWMEPISS